MNIIPFGLTCKLQNGKAFKPSDWSDMGTPIVRIQNLNDESKTFNFCSTEVEERFHIDTGELLFSWSGTPGTSFGAFLWNRGKAYINQHIFKVSVDKNIVDKNYLRYAINSKLNHIIDQAHGGVGLKHITKGKLEAIQIPLPPLKEQKRIAVILDKADAIRRKRQQAIDLTDQLLRSVFLDMFGDPVTNPKGVELSPMTEVFHITTGKLNSNAAVEGGQYVFFTCAKEVFEIDTYAFDQEALLLAGNNAQAEYDVKHFIGKFNAYQRTYILSLKNKRSSYPFYKFALEYQLENLKRFSKGSNTKYITLEIMERTMLPLVNPDQQLEFVRRVEAAQSLKNIYLNYSELSEANFNSLTQNAFRGELTKQTEAA